MVVGSLLIIVHLHLTIIAGKLAAAITVPVIVAIIGGVLGIAALVLYFKKGVCSSKKVVRT